MKSDLNEVVSLCRVTTESAMQTPVNDTIYGTVEYHYCGEIKTAKGARPITVEVEAGRTGESWSLGGRSMLGNWNSSGMAGSGNRASKGLGIRYNSGRKYYKQVRTYICADCIECGANLTENDSTDDAGVFLDMFLKFLVYSWMIVGIVWSVQKII